MRKLLVVAVATVGLAIAGVAQITRSFGQTPAPKASVSKKSKAKQSPSYTVPKQGYAESSIAKQEKLIEALRTESKKPTAWHGTSVAFSNNPDYEPDGKLEEMVAAFRRNDYTPPERAKAFEATAKNPAYVITGWAMMARNFHALGSATVAEFEVCPRLLQLKGKSGKPAYAMPLRKTIEQWQFVDGKLTMLSLETSGKDYVGGSLGGPPTEEQIKVREAELQRYKDHLKAGTASLPRGFADRQAKVNRPLRKPTARMINDAGVDQQQLEPVTQP